MARPPAPDPIKHRKFLLPMPAQSAAAGRAWGLALLTIAVAALLPFTPSLPLHGVSPPLLASLHLVVKMLGAGIALAISLLTWNTRRGQPLNFVLAGFAVFAVAVLGAGQILMLPGMPGLATGHAPRIVMVLQLGADTAAVVALWAAALGPARPGSARALRWGIALTAAGLAASIFLAVGAPRWSHGTDRVAAGVELTLALAAFVAAVLLLRRYRRGQAPFGLLALAALLGAVGMALAARLPLEDVAQVLLNDAYRVLACLLVYRALFREGVLAPWHRLVESGRAVEEDRRRYRQLFESAPDGLLLVDAAGAIVQANPAAATMFGWPVAEMTGNSVDALVPQPLRGGHERARARFLAEPETREMGRGGSLIAARRDGGTFPVEVALVPQEDGDGRSTLCIVRDVTERRQLEQSLMLQALQDALTDLPNRRHFRDSVTKALAHAERHGGALALMFIDLDNFKQINDTLGHSHGDELLRQVAQRLGKTLRAGDLLARMGGDEFALLLADAQAEDAAAVAGKVLRVLEPEFMHTGQTMKVGASIGITMYPADGRSVEELLSHADIAMYRAKHRGRNTWCFFAPQVTARVRERSPLPS